MQVNCHFRDFTTSNLEWTAPPTEKGMSNVDSAKELRGLPDFYVRWTVLWLLRIKEDDLSTILEAKLEENGQVHNILIY